MQSTRQHLIQKIFYRLRRWDQKIFYLLAVLAIAVTYTALGSALPSRAAPAEDTPAPEATLEGEPDQTPTPEPVSPEDEDPAQVRRPYGPHLSLHGGLPAPGQYLPRPTRYRSRVLPVMQQHGQQSEHTR
jgi:hypothetical protein